MKANKVMISFKLDQDKDIILKKLTKIKHHSRSSFIRKTLLEKIEQDYEEENKK